MPKLQNHMNNLVNQDVMQSEFIGINSIIYNSPTPRGKTGPQLGTICLIDPF